jgi:hypothetical protein
MLPLVIDKSFAQAAKIERLEELRRRFVFLVPSAFYYELFSTTDKSRKQAAQGFPTFHRVHLSILFKQERETGEPADSLEFHPMAINPAVSKLDFRLASPYAELQEQHRRESVEPRIDFLIESLGEGIPGFANDELAGCGGASCDFTALCAELRNPERIRALAAELGHPHASILDQRWIYFRHLQSLMLQVMVVRRRYGNPKNLISRKNLEHDVEDMEYLTLGLHAGHLATRETSSKFEKMGLKWRFEVLQSSGLVITA